jgi:hypothetical protein
MLIWKLIAVLLDKSKLTEEVFQLVNPMASHPSLMKTDPCMLLEAKAKEDECVVEMQQHAATEPAFRKTRAGGIYMGLKVSSGAKGQSSPALCLVDGQVMGQMTGVPWSPGGDARLTCRRSSHPTVARGPLLATRVGFSLGKCAQDKVLLLPRALLNWFFAQTARDPLHFAALMS